MENNVIPDEVILFCQQRIKELQTAYNDLEAVSLTYVCNRNQDDYKLQKVAILRKLQEFKTFINENTVDCLS